MVDSYPEFLVRLSGREEKRDKQKRLHLLDDALAYLAILHAVGDEAKSVTTYQNALRLQSGASTRRTKRHNGSAHKFQNPKP